MAPPLLLTRMYILLHSDFGRILYCINRTALTVLLQPVPQVRRTAAYVDQVDNHLAELSVRETLGFATCYQGSGLLPGARLRVMLQQLSRCHYPC